MARNAMSAMDRMADEPFSTMLAWSLMVFALLGCSSPVRVSETGFVEIRPVVVPKFPADRAFKVVLGPELSRRAKRHAIETTQGRSYQEFLLAEQEASRLVVEEELRRQGLCISGVEVAGVLLHQDHSPNTEIVVRCLARSN